MKFSEIPYIRPDVEEFKKSYVDKIERFKNASTAQEQIEIWREVNVLNIEFSSKAGLVKIRYSLNTQDAELQAEQDFWDEVGPTLEEYEKDFNKAVLISKFRSELIENFGEYIYHLYDLSDKTFSPEVVGELQEDNKLTSEFEKITGGAEIPFEGKTYNLSDIGVFFSESDREKRYGAWEAYAARYQKYDSKLNEIYDQMVAVRHREAKKLGYENYVRLGYDSMGRDYTPEQVSSLREYIATYIVPLCTELYGRQAEYIGVDVLYAHDEEVLYPEGNPKPIGAPEEIVEKAKKMYHELSLETGEFFDVMMENGLMDLVSKPGKAPGGYAAYLEAYKLPFIFSNFNGTTDDIDVLTHEVGHAFQFWMSKDAILPEYHSPTAEACEIHSMSMEYCALPWMKEFFGDQAQKYEYIHLVNSLKFLPYGCAIDEFQQRVYEQAENPKRSYEEIRQELVVKYMPHRKYLNNPYLEAGNGWKHKAHIFANPLYYIDYVLAQICAYQFWMKFEQDQKNAWADYKHLCSLGGSKPFLELVKEAKLESPFDPSTIEKTVAYARAWLEKNPLKK